MATIKDVANKAGVAISTASYALNGKTSKVNDQTAEKVLKVAKELNYRPNAIARSLARKKTDTIGLFLLLEHSDLNHPTIIELIVGIMDISREHGYDILLFSNREVGDVSYIEKCKERSVDGAIIFGMYNDDPYIKDIENSEIPIISLDVPVSGEQATYISYDHQRGAYKAVKYLLEQGHESIAFVNGFNNAPESKQRLAGYKSAYQEAGGQFQSDLIVNGEFDRKIAYQQTIELLESNQEFSAIFVATNLMSLGVMDALNDREIDVPEDISVIGFDDITLDDSLSLNITTIGQKKGEEGRLAIEKLINVIEGDESLDPVLLDYELVERGTVAKK